MNKQEYKTKRAALLKKRIRLMMRLESQMDFPEQETIAEYEANKRQLINLDDQWERQHVPIQILRLPTRQGD